MFLLPRLILKQILGLLSRWAIRKHDIELVVVTGYFGTELVREGIYEVLKKRFQVRRNTDQISWDMALPLSVLGYADRRRNIFEWLWLIFRASVYLLFGPKNQHILVLNANCTFRQTAKFWGRFLKPDYLVVLNYEKESPIFETLVKNLKPEKSLCIYDQDNIDESLLGGLRNIKKFRFGSKDKSADLVYNSAKREISYKSYKEKLPKIIPNLMVTRLAGVYAFCLNHGFDFHEIGLEIVKIDFGSILVNRIKKNFDKKRPV